MPLLSAFSHLDGFYHLLSITWSANVVEQSKEFFGEAWRVVGKGGPQAGEQPEDGLNAVDALYCGQVLVHHNRLQVSEQGGKMVNADQMTKSEEKG